MNQQTTAKKKVIVIGGGVAGLSAAQELALRGFAVDVYERKAVFGGKARSIDFQPRDGVVLPAEHGFRFFPGFYRHIVETMKQIPTRGGHVSDHFVRMSELRGVGDTKTNPVFGVLPLEPLWRWSGFVKWVAFLPALVASAPGADGKRLTGRDLGFFARRFWDFACTCRERRVQQFEQLPWSEYVQASRSDAYGQYLSAGLTRNLVAARADRASTLTVGTIGLQLLLDALRALFLPSGLDRVLNGPTSEVWIKPWIEFLKEKGVVFHTGFELNDIEIAPGSARPCVTSVSFRRATPHSGPQRLEQLPAQESAPHLEETCSWLSQRTESEHAESKEGAKRAREAETHAALAEMGRAAAERRSADYYVFAIPIEQMSTFVTPAVLQRVPSWGNLPKLAKSVEWMNGVLFYLTSRSTFPPGHTTYLDSDWALTSVFQDDAIWPGWGALDPRVQQILSVDVSNWTVPRMDGPRRGKSASELARDEVIEEVWDQVKRALSARTGYVINDAQRRYSFVDEDIEERLNARKTLTFQRSDAARRRAQKTLLTNAEPLLVNQTGTRALRPEAAGDLENGFLASDYVLTETDLATMEGANEAARRAVNGLLGRENRSDFCTLVPLKEPLEFLRRWDLARFKAGRPSPAMVQALGIGIDWSVRVALLVSQALDAAIRFASRLLGRPQRLGEVAAPAAQPPAAGERQQGMAAIPEARSGRQRREDEKASSFISS